MIFTSKSRGNVVALFVAIFGKFLPSQLLLEASVFVQLLFALLGSQSCNKGPHHFIKVAVKLNCETIAGLDPLEFLFFPSSSKPPPPPPPKKKKRH